MGWAIRDTERCIHCGHEFADHDYVKDSITDYKCPHPRVESIYGYFHGGDPRDFHPDYESCTKTEIERHKKACELWNESEAKGVTPEPEACPSGWIFDDNGKPVAHVLRSSYGIGTYVVEFESFFEAAETSDCGVDDEEEDS